MNDTDRTDRLVDDYLRRLEQAAYALPPERRAELVLEIRDHIAEARASAGGATDEAWTRTLLDRLGDPAEIVAAASDGEPVPTARWASPAPVLVERRRGTGLELAAVLLLTIGSVVPVVGWIAGVICLWASRRWRTWEKLLGTLIVPGGPFGLLVLASLYLPARTCQSFSVGALAPGSGPSSVRPGTTTCTGFALHPALGIPLLVFTIIAPIVVAGWLYSRARARAALESPAIVVVPPGRPGSPWGGVEIAAIVLLAIGGFVVPFIGPFIGLALAWSSSAWTTSQKAIATGIASLGLLIPIVGLLVAL